MTAAAARIAVLALLLLAACQPGPKVEESKREPVEAEAANGRADVRVEPAEEAVAVVGAGPPLVVVPGQAERIANCLHGTLTAHPGLASLGLAPAPLEALDTGGYRLQPRKAIRFQLGTTGTTANKKRSTTEEIGRMTYTTTVAPAGGNRVAVYFEPKAPDLSGTVLDSLMETVRKQTRRQARVCAL